ncbi:uncharacterized protein NPIL_665031 [Nephila pilipes]|uniref:Uncharacterized protein n=1 Tax=Nephila pilipes TaxID=299642 RepID=A0A8X6MMP6_NEPPI|nr:uncharacterized protein NPIL_665031 [Nephila pilipes]
MAVQSNTYPVTFTNERSVEENDNNYFGIYSKVVSKIFEIGRQLSTKQEDSGDSFTPEVWKIAPENLFDIESDSDSDNPDKKEYSDECQNLIASSNLNVIPCDIQNPLGSLLPKLELQGEVWSSLYSSEDNGSERSLKKSFDGSGTLVDSAVCLPPHISKTIQESSIDSWQTESLKNSNKLIPLFSTSYSHFKARFKDQWPYVIDSSSSPMNSNKSKNLCNNVLNNNIIRSQSSLQLRDSYFKSLVQSQISGQGPTKNVFSKSETDLNNLCYPNLPSSDSKNKFLFGTNGRENVRSSSEAKLEKNSSLFLDVDISRFSAQHKPLECNLNTNSVKEEISLRNGRKTKKDAKIPNQMKPTPPRKLPAPTLTDKKCFSRETKPSRRKNKRDTHCEFSNLKTIPEIKLLSDKQFKNIESNFNFRNICENLILNDFCLEFPDSENFNRLRFSEPVLLNFTKNIGGKSQEMLLCTNDVLEDVQTDRCSKDVVIRRLLARSKIYTGKPIHIFFDPRKVINASATVKSTTDNSVLLHPSRGKHNLLSNKLKDGRKTNHCNDNYQDGNGYAEHHKEETITKNSIHKPSKSKDRKSTSGEKGSHNRQTNRLQISCYEVSTHTSENSGKKKLIIRFCRKKKSRTALKRVNVKQITTSVFKNFFHFYSLLGGHLYSGSVITKSNSSQWLKEAGVATDPRSQEIANELFKAIAGAKIVLNIFDYMQFLIVFARQQKIAATDLVKQLTVCKRPQEVSNRDRYRNFEFRRPKTAHLSKHAVQRVETYRSMSLPNL